MCSCFTTQKSPPHLKRGRGAGNKACLCALSFVFVSLAFAGSATLSRIVTLLLARSSPLLFIPLRFLFTRRVRLFLSGLLLSRRILLLLLPTRLLALICFVCHLENS